MDSVVCFRSFRFCVFVARQPRTFRGRNMQALVVPADRLSTLQRNLIDYALGDGLLMVPKEAKPGNAVHVPMTCYPTMIPRQSFEFVQNLSKYYNILVDKASRDSDFLITNLKQSAITDDFLHKLLEVFQASKPVQVALFPDSSQSVWEFIDLTTC